MATPTETELNGTGPPPAYFAPAVRSFPAQREFVRRFKKQPLGVGGFVILVIIILLAAVGPSIAPSDPYELGTAGRLKPPSLENFTGTDHLGRDVLSRVIYGIRPSIVVALGAVMISVSVGGLIGGISGYLGGVTDLVAQRVMDAISALPSLFLGVLVLTILTPSYFNLMIAIGFVTAPDVQRVVRASTLSEKERDYILAGKVVGARHGRLLFRHILPNILAPILVIASAELGSAILIAASLSFLGFGTPPPEPSLGAMVSGEGRQYMQQAPWLVLVPAGVISLAILSANFVGDALRDVLDPRLRF